jgi:hypothetical protein
MSSPPELAGDSSAAPVNSGGGERARGGQMRGGRARQPTRGGALGLIWARPGPATLGRCGRAPSAAMVRGGRALAAAMVRGGRAPTAARAGRGVGAWGRPGAGAGRWLRRPGTTRRWWWVGTPRRWWWVGKKVSNFFLSGQLEVEDDMPARVGNFFFSI